MALAGPKDVTGAFIEGGTLTLVDGRGNSWRYDTSVTEDADGNEIVAPSSIDTVIVAPARERLIVVSGGDYWTYNLNQGEWHEGLSATELLEGEEEKTTDPWKRGHNVETPKPEDEVTPAKKRKKEAA
jgi:hypothetical protein